MKAYYYNNQLVRISENNNYKYALLFRRSPDLPYYTVMCSKNYDSCLNELNYKTKAESIAKEKGMTIEEVYKSRKYNLASSQYHERKHYIIVELEGREED